MGVNRTGTGVDAPRPEEERGSVATEYGLLLALVALAIIAAVTLFGGQVMRMIQTGADAF